MKMKPDTIVYLHETFHLTKDLSVTQWAWQGVAKRPLIKAQKNGFSGPFLGIFSNISKPIIYVILDISLHHW